jgi:hypothetical protein
MKLLEKTAEYLQKEYLNIVAFIVCLAGVLSQMYQIVDHLDNESTYFEIKETVYDSIEMPSITICSVQGYRTNRYVSIARPWKYHLFFDIISYKNHTRYNSCIIYRQNQNKRCTDILETRSVLFFICTVVTISTKKGSYLRKVVHI